MRDYSLCLAFDKMTAGIGAAMTVDRTLRIELLETLLIGNNPTVTPYLLALQI